MEGKFAPRLLDEGKTQNPIIRGFVLPENLFYTSLIVRENVRIKRMWEDSKISVAAVQFDIVDQRDSADMHRCRS